MSHPSFFCRTAMAAGYNLPYLRAAGAGATQVASQNVLQVPMPAGLANGDFVLLHLMSRTPAILPTTLDGWTFLNNRTFSGDGRHQVTFWRFADGTEGTQTVVLAGLPNVALGRTYAWRGVVTTPGGTLSDVTDAAVSNSFTMPSFTTSTTNTLLVFAGCADENPAIASATGETGGDWELVVAKHGSETGNNASIFCQTAAMAATGSISGGSFSIGSGNDGARVSFELYGISGVPSFVAAGTGVEQGVVATLTAAIPAGVVAGDLLFAQFASRTTALPNKAAGWTLRASDASGTREQYLYSRVATGSDVSLVLPVTGSLDLCLARMYAFDDASGTFEDSEAAVMSSSILTGPTLGPSSQANSLGVSFIFIDDDEAIGAYTGASGGTWAEAVAEYTSATGNDGCISCQTVAMAAAGTTVSGGTITTTSDEGVSRSLIMLGTAA